MMRPTDIVTWSLGMGMVNCLPVLEGTMSQNANLDSRAPWQPSVGSSWQIVLSQKLKIDPAKPSVAPNVDIFDIDMFSHLGTPTISSLHQLNKRVICYFSAGSYEPGRPDSALFTSAVKGSELQGWPGEFWLNLTSPVVRNLMSARILLAAQMGCDAIDPDNVDGYQNKNGLKLTARDSIEFVKFLANEAAKHGMGIGLKNALEIIPDVLPYVQFAVNEQCAQYDECTDMQQFISAGKPVFHIEYIDGGKRKRSIQIRNHNTAQGHRTTSSVRLGCYVDSRERRVLQGDFDDDDNMTPQMCQRYCSGFAYFGVEQGDQCFCSNAMPALIKQPDSECKTVCTGRMDQTCGGRQRIEVYQIFDIADSATSSSRVSTKQSTATYRTSTTTIRTTSTSVPTPRTTFTTAKASTLASTRSSQVATTTHSSSRATTMTTTLATSQSTNLTAKTSSTSKPVVTPTTSDGSSSGMSCKSFRNINGFSTIIKKLSLDEWVQFCG